MPQYAVGNLWDEVGRATLFLVTTNPTLRRKDQGLVMGRGAAAQMRDYFPGIEQEAGRRLILRGVDYYMWEGETRRPLLPYGLLMLGHSVTKNECETFLGLFQVKWYWGDAADPELIAHSCCALRDWVGDFYREFPDKPCRVALNYPGIGNGRLSEAVVRPILDRYLPDEVVIYKLPQKTQGAKAVDQRQSERAVA